MNYKIYILDFEVFKYDWLVVISDTEGKEIKVIHNNNAELKRFVCRSGLIFGGYNNKHYDDYILQTILIGGTPEDVKACNDWIIVYGQQGFEFPMIKGTRKPFISFDLMDDIPVPLSLKAIEANIGEPIVESSVDFNIDHPLNAKELEETIYYCKSDVANTVKLYHLRRDYLEGKIAVGRLKGWDESVSLPPTNPKLTAKFLDARFVDRRDGDHYDPPKELRLTKYREALKFFDVIDYKAKFELEVAGVVQKYGWGGIHSAREHYFDQSDDNYLIVDIDVGSYYPSLMIQYGYSSRNIPNADGYAEIYRRRLDAKHAGRDEEAGALKLILNSCFGASRNISRAPDGTVLFANPLADEKNNMQICVTGQLFLTDLIEKLETVEGLTLIQTNTDGIMIKFPRTEEEHAKRVVREWENRTRMNMEWTVIKKIAQKDVNNYCLISGETYLFEKDGTKVVTKPDKNKVATKGGWVSMWNGGTWKNNSLSIVHKALVNFFIYGIKPERTITEETDIFRFQMVCKTGSTFTGTVWTVDGEDVPVQKVNRVYASKDPRFGQLFKLKGTQKNKMPDVPEHCLVDNENKCTLDAVDKQFYIDLAWKRIRDYQGDPEPKLKRKKEKIMAVAKTEDFSKLNLMQKMNKIRLDFLKSDVKKSGVNRYIGYDYFELKDIVPVACQLFEKYGVYHEFVILSDAVYMRFMNADDPNEATRDFILPLVHNSVNKGQTEIQVLGGEITYYRRYLYLMALDIVEAEIFDAEQGKDDDQNATKRAETPVDATKSTQKVNTTKRNKTESVKANERAEAVAEMTTGEMDDVLKKSIQTGLKTLRSADKNGEFIEWINDVWSKARVKGYNKQEAEQILIEIGEKVEGLKG